MNYGKYVAGADTEIFQGGETKLLLNDSYEITMQ